PRTFVGAVPRRNVRDLRRGPDLDGARTVQGPGALPRCADRDRHAKHRRKVVGCKRTLIQGLNTFMTQSILVTGAAGFIGYHVAEKLLARGDRVVGYDNVNDYYDPS